MTTMQSIPIVELKPSPTNPRKHFDPDKLRELAASLTAVGVIEPLVVRVAPKKNPGTAGFEIVAGERRYRAAKLAGLAEVPAVVKDLTDVQVIELQLIENLQRDDLTPLEEGRGYRALIDSDPKKHSAESIAARIGKSPKYVWDRMKLLDLAPPAMKLLESGRISAGHGILIARLTKKDQERAIAGGDGLDRGEGGLWQHEKTDEADLEADRAISGETADPYAGLKPVSVAELGHWIAHHVRFDPAQAAAAAPHEFAAVRDTVARAPGGKFVQITYEYRPDDDVRKDGGGRIIGEAHWKRADGQPHVDHWGGKPEPTKTCAHAVLGVVACGPNRGQAFAVCIDKEKCAVHWGKEQKEKARRAAERAKEAKGGGGGKGAAAVERAEAERKRRQAEQEAFEKIAPELMKSVVESFRKAAVGPMLARAEEILDAQMYGFGDAYTHLGLKKCGSAEDLVRLVVLFEMIGQLEHCFDAKDFCKIAGPYGGGLGPILKRLQTSAAEPEPAKATKPAKAAKATKTKRK